MSEKYGLRVANVFHAGDGNLHPLILYDANKEGELERAEQFGADILRLCVEVGGVLTGEHGVGVEKRDLMPVMFSEAISISSSASNAPSTTRACSIPARCFRRSTAAPNLAACTCMPGASRFPIFRGSDHSLILRHRNPAAQGGQSGQMQFGIFSSAQAKSNDLGPEIGQGFHDYLDFSGTAEGLGYHSCFSG